MEEAIRVARQSASQVTVGDPGGSFALGPVVSKGQFDKIQALIQRGIDEGATLVTGGTGRPDGLEQGYYAKPTVFANVTNDMTIAREEIFGPVLTILGYHDVDDAIEIANDTEYGLLGLCRGRRPGAGPRRRAPHPSGVCNDQRWLRFHSPFGGYKKSGNGREWGEFGFDDYLEIKGVLGYLPVGARRDLTGSARQAARHHGARGG